MTFKRHSLLVLALAVFVFALAACSSGDDSEVIGPPAPPEAVPDIAGTYVVNGLDPLGAEYGGHLTITDDETENGYHLQWIVTGSIQEGSGTLEGNQLRVNWQTLSSAAGESQGQALYTVTVDGVLDGTRSVEGLEGEGTETAFPNE